MSIAALIAACLAAALHGYIFVMESLRWTDERTRATFGLTQQQALDTREMAFNQGFYNLFLAVIAVAGVVAWPHSRAVGAALIYAGTGAMLAAGLVLLISSPAKARAAITQLALPLLTVVTLTVSLLR